MPWKAGKCISRGFMFKLSGGACPKPPLETQALLGLQNVPTYFTATGDNLHATAASKLNDSPE